MQPSHPIIQPFISYLKFEKRYSKHTIISYQTDLTSFFDYLITQYGETSVDQITPGLVRSWMASLKDDQLTSKSINRKISTLKSFFKYHMRTGDLKVSPMGRVIAPKNEKRLPAFVAGKDIQTLFQYVEFPDDWQGGTDRLLLLIFYHTGMRLSELIGLKNSQVNAASNTLKVLGKGNKERIIPVPPELMNQVSQYIKNKKVQFSEISDSLLVDGKGKSLAPRKVYTSVKKYLSLVTTIEKRSPHILRHTFATHLTNNGADLNAVKELLGHSSLASTQVYTHNSIEKLKNIHKKTHPKG